MPDQPLPLPEDMAAALGRAAARFAGAVPQVMYFSTVSSTNDVAARLAAQAAADGTAVVADLQTSGRGRLGRTWYSPPGAGLYVSVVVRTDRLMFAPLLTLTSGVALAEAVRACTHLPVDIKWPNDLVVGRRKLAGILTEASGVTDVQSAVVGFGINLRSAAYPAEIADRATSIEAELGRPIDRGIVLAECLASMSAWIDALRAGRGDAILERWRSLAPSCRGTRVEWTGPSGRASGITDGIDEDGALRVRVGERVERIIAGEVTWE